MCVRDPCRASRASARCFRPWPFSLFSRSAIMLSKTSVLTQRLSSSVLQRRCGKWSFDATHGSVSYACCWYRGCLHFPVSPTPHLRFSPSRTVFPRLLHWQRLVWLPCWTAASPPTRTATFFENRRTMSSGLSNCSRYDIVGVQRTLSVSYSPPGSPIYALWLIPNCCSITLMRLRRASTKWA